ncbi:ThiF family adenylyltransferase [Capnocytophaga sp. oral taxon 338]|jgi:Dinucleotide-utilizing enzymes involved in molybdopterin and thiamine biosynthesis family 1|uniref:tRNA threonylcarbamoyladenosine dehydratase n=1 Tax=Capnocytophaga sp. oral taxon 338 TaxID=710239 RepID=UPI000202DBBE|nr:tRNA threonylcarbamoyladenosine dehydratase [Capnocytophaga sp. oral taxon 338]EGD34407.1 hydrogenase accessory protein HypB [Capnocytophaga sp. oral taxon 338 str. F0234]
MWKERTKLVIKDQGLHKLEQSHILVVGLGGVGAFVAEFLVRAGVGHLTIVDGDVVDITNKNRQLIALDSTIGEPKVKLMANRLKDINPQIELKMIKDFLTPESAYDLVSKEFAYVADCIDSISPKISLLRACHDKRVKVISSMGSGGILDPSKVKVADISQTRDCPLARTIRKRLKKEGIQPKFKAVFSLELPSKDMMVLTDGSNFKRSYYGTMSYMPALFGIHIAGVIIRKLIE